MGNDEITRLSRREHALYGELAALYRGMLEALTDERAPVDLSRLAADGARADAAVRALGLPQAPLAPARAARAARSPVGPPWPAAPPPPRRRPAVEARGLRSRRRAP